MNIGPFDRGGRNRVLIKTEDHDYSPKTTVTPYGIFLPELMISVGIWGESTLALSIVC